MNTVFGFVIGLSGGVLFGAVVGAVLMAETISGDQKTKKEKT